jgi:pimeloyl-ACP methyl ester carboxylesterase
MQERAEIGKYVDIGSDVEIYCEETGRGAPIVFVPGWTMTTEFFHHQQEYFSRSHRVIVIDPRSQGRSPTQAHGNNYCTHARDLALFIRKLGLEDVVLVGWSAGNHTVWKYVEQEGTEALKALVTIDMSPVSMSVNSDDWTEGSVEDLSGAYNILETSQGHRTFIEGYAKELMVQRELTEAELFWIVEQSAKTPTAIARELFASMLFSNCMKGAELASNSAPTLNFIAEHWSNVAEPFMSSHFPKTRNVVFGGHLLFWEHHEKFNKALDEFISGIRSV